MIDRPGEQIGDGGEIDVRVRADVYAFARRQMRRPHLIEEDERTDRWSAPCAAACGRP
jgi:hypothetical protein